MVAEENTTLLKSEEYKNKLNEITKLVQTYCPIDIQDPIDHKKLCNNEDILSIISECNYKGGKDQPYWVLDPIDGTCGFLRHEQYSIGLALVDNGIPILGVIGCPNMKMKDNDHPSLFYASNNNGCYCEALDDDTIAPQKLSNELCKLNNDYITSVEATHSNEELVRKIAIECKFINEPVKMDSMVKYCLVARGDISLYLRIVKDKNYTVY